MPNNNALPSNLILSSLTYLTDAQQEAALPGTAAFKLNIGLTQPIGTSKYTPPSISASYPLQTNLATLSNQCGLLCDTDQQKTANADKAFVNLYDIMDLLALCTPIAIARMGNLINGNMCVQSANGLIVSINISYDRASVDLNAVLASTDSVNQSAVDSEMNNIILQYKNIATSSSLIYAQQHALQVWLLGHDLDFAIKKVTDACKSFTNDANNTLTLINQALDLDDKALGSNSYRKLNPSFNANIAAWLAYKSSLNNDRKTHYNTLIASCSKTLLPEVVKFAITNLYNNGFDMMINNKKLDTTIGGGLSSLQVAQNRAHNLFYDIYYEKLKSPEGFTSDDIATLAANSSCLTSQFIKDALDGKVIITVNSNTETVSPIDPTLIVAPRVVNTQDPSTNILTTTTNAQGETVVTSEDGAVMTLKKDGRVFIHKKDGTDIIKYQDGTSLVSDPEGHETKYDSVGVILSVDGVAANNTQVINKAISNLITNIPTVKATPTVVGSSKNSDGSILDEYSDGSTKTRLVTKAPVSNADGSKSNFDADGNFFSTTPAPAPKNVTCTGKTINTDGSITNTYSDGTTKLWPVTKAPSANPDGSMTYYDADGNVFKTTLPSSSSFGRIVNITPSTNTAIQPEFSFLGMDKKQTAATGAVAVLALLLLFRAMKH